MNSLTTSESELTVRLSLGDDDRDRGLLRRLAAHGGGLLPKSPVFFAELGGAPVAALSLTDGKLVADPLLATAAVVLLLHMRRFEARLIGSIWGA